MKKLLIAFVGVVALLVHVFATEGFAQEGLAQNAAVPATSDKVSAPRTLLDADGFETDFDASNYSRMATSVGFPQEVQKAPVFNNAPFLRLKDGDKLVKGQGRSHYKAGGGFDGRVRYFLSSGGRYYDLDNYSTDDFKFWHVTTSLRFDWDLTLANASKLYVFHCRDSSFRYPLSLESYRSLRAELHQKFPEYLRVDTGLVVRDPVIEGTAANKHAVFESLNFDTHTNMVFHYRVLIGPKTYIIKRKPLIVGPRRVRRRELFGDFTSGPEVPNDNPFPYRPTPETVAIAKVENEKSQAFLKVVASFFSEPKREHLFMLHD